MRRNDQVKLTAESAPPQRDIRPLRRLLPFMRPYLWQVLGALAALTIAAGTVLAIGAGLRQVVDLGFMTANPDMLDTSLAWMFGAILVLASATYTRFYLVSWVGERVVTDLRQAVFAHLLQLSPSFFETARSGDLITRLTTDTSVIQLVVGSSISVALRNGLLLLGGLTMLLLTSGHLTMLVLVVVPLVIAPIIIIGRHVRRYAKLAQEKLADVSANIDETVHGIKTVQAYTHEALEEKQFNTKAEAALSAALLRIRARALMSMIVISLVFTAIGVILWIGGHDVLEGAMSAGQLTSFIFYAMIVAGSVGAISEVSADLQRAAGATERIFELMAVTPDITAPADPLPLPQPLRGNIRFQAVTFCYPSRPEQPAINRLNLDIAAGEKLALVGSSGAGKTTLFQLLLRFYDPQQGGIAIDGVDVRRLHPVTLRQQIGLVAQEPVIFSLNAWDNIRYGRPDATNDEVMAAAKAAYADSFLLKLPEGLNSHLGEKGVRLSGGQRQRIAIARAVLRNPPILLLDEATSALDAESERYVQQALERLMQGRTTIIIAHRLATVINADRIAVLDNGVIVGSGTHRELIAQNGLYAKLAKLQFEQGTQA